MLVPNADQSHHISLGGHFAEVVGGGQNHGRVDFITQEAAGLRVGHSTGEVRQKDGHAVAARCGDGLRSIGIQNHFLDHGGVDGVGVEGAFAGAEEEVVAVAENVGRVIGIIHMNLVGGVAGEVVGDAEEVDLNGSVKVLRGLQLGADDVGGVTQHILEGGEVFCVGVFHRGVVLVGGAGAGGEEEKQGGQREKRIFSWKSLLWGWNGGSFIIIDAVWSGILQGAGGRRMRRLSSGGTHGCRPTRGNRGRSKSGGVEPRSYAGQEVPCVSAAG